MFTGIIETIGEITAIDQEGTNLHFTIKASIASELKIDQSIAHDGVCLTVVELGSNSYKVTAIEETLQKSRLKFWKVGGQVNLERAMKLGDRLDGHLVQGHVDQVGVCKQISEKNGSWIYTFSYDDSFGNVTVEKGSITVNGVSLTVVNSTKGQFEVAIIPYTHKHTNFHKLEVDGTVNLEFDIIGKYLKRLSQAYS